MESDYSNNSNANIGNEELKLKELSPNSIFCLKQEFSRNPSGFHLGRKQAMSILGGDYHYNRKLNKIVYESN